MIKKHSRLKLFKEFSYSNKKQKIIFEKKTSKTSLPLSTFRQDREEEGVPPCIRTEQVRRPITNSK